MSKKPALVLDGSAIKVRLQTQRATGAVHVDWLRFTCFLRNSVIPDLDLLFPPPKTGNYWDEQRNKAMRDCFRIFNEQETWSSVQAYQLAQDVALALGDGFSVAAEPLKGQDFYAHRWPILRAGHECGWVGYGASSDSPRQKKQALTLHCNLYGNACTFAADGWRERVAKLIDDVQGKITRIDYALDFFDGIAGGMERVRSDYRNGLCDVYGKRPKCSLYGDWDNEGEAQTQGRSYYIGSKEAGKQTNIYEKGHQLFGLKAQDPWQRIELRYGNKLRYIDTDALRNPAEHFAGASDWHASMLKEHGEIVAPQPIPCTPKLQDKTVKAAVLRVLRWLENTAAPAMAFAFKHATESQFLQLVSTSKIPKRLQAFKSDECADVLHRLGLHQFSVSHACPA